MDSQSSEQFVGIDVSKERLDICIHPAGIDLKVTNQEEGFKELVTLLTPVSPTLIILEATGGLEAPVLAALASAKFPVVMVNPRQVRDFAKALGILAKTDTIDAAVLARFGQATRPEVRAFKDQEALDLSALVTRRRQIIDMLTEEKNRAARASKAIHHDIQRNIAWLEQLLRDIETRLNKTIRSSPAWKEKDNLLRSMPGVGKVLSFSLIAGMPELGLLSKRKVAALVGVAPMNRDSGTLRGIRSVWGGRARIRHVLYMATVAALRHNPVIHAFHQRLISAGKKPKVAIVACMHKLIVILNAMVKNNQSWRVSTESVA